MKNSASDMLVITPKLQVRYNLQVALFGFIKWPFFEESGVRTVKTKGMSQVIMPNELLKLLLFRRRKYNFLNLISLFPMHALLIRNN